jgi:hypothetical protein
VVVAAVLAVLAGVVVAGVEAGGDHVAAAERRGVGQRGSVDEHAGVGAGAGAVGVGADVPRAGGKSPDASRGVDEQKQAVSDGPRQSRRETSKGRAGAAVDRITAAYTRSRAALNDGGTAATRSASSVDST